MTEMFRSIAAKVIAKQKEGRPPPKTIGQLMKEKVQQQREEVRQAIISFPYFVTWPEDAYVEAAAISNIRDYKPDDIIHGYNREKSNYVYFVMEGIACVLQRLKIETMTDKTGKQRYKLIRDEMEETQGVEAHNEQKVEKTRDSTAGQIVRDIFMQLCVITKGECFGIGSELKNGRTVVAKTAVTCILIPRYVIYNNDYANMWSRIEQFLSSRMPNTQELFQKFVEGRKWIQYRESEFNKTLKSQKENRARLKTTLHDTPYHWRIKSIDTFNDRQDNLKDGVRIK
ncbi:hypothetical protein LSTR_LSTR008048 [Laodelphax striatellus]|uniref:Cyclic nucleotide-binding domain-containing protein n=1 Tax=Laodelphax striatellus TaxID=195883 RepID=A0A482XLL1_LAOST|nr:hypothetical protein LSTR_LSTR008048 [Laodelphax striatellus]